MVKIQIGCLVSLYEPRNASQRRTMPQSTGSGEVANF